MTIENATAAVEAFRQEKRSKRKFRFSGMGCQEEGNDVTNEAEKAENGDWTVRAVLPSKKETKREHERETPKQVGAPPTTKTAHRKCFASWVAVARGAKLPFKSIKRKEEADIFGRGVAERGLRWHALRLEDGTMGTVATVAPSRARPEVMVAYVLRKDQTEISEATEMTIENATAAVEAFRQESTPVKRARTREERKLKRKTKARPPARGGGDEAQQGDRRRDHPPVRPQAIREEDNDEEDEQGQEFDDVARHLFDDVRPGENASSRPEWQARSSSEWERSDQGPSEEFCHWRQKSKPTFCILHSDLYGELARDRRAALEMLTDSQRTTLREADVILVPVPPQAANERWGAVTVYFPEVGGASIQLIWDEDPHMDLQLTAQKVVEDFIRAARSETIRELESKKRWALGDYEMDPHCAGKGELDLLVEIEKFRYSMINGVDRKDLRWFGGEVVNAKLCWMCDNFQGQAAVTEMEGPLDHQEERFPFLYSKFEGEEKYSATTVIDYNAGCSSDDGTYLIHRPHEDMQWVSRWMMHPALLSRYWQNLSNAELTSALDESLQRNDIHAFAHATLATSTTGGVVYVHPLHQAPGINITNIDMRSARDLVRCRDVRHWPGRRTKCRDWHHWQGRRAVAGWIPENLCQAIRGRAALAPRTPSIRGLAVTILNAYLGETMLDWMNEAYAEDEEADGDRRSPAYFESRGTNQEPTMSVVDGATCDEDAEEGSDEDRIGAYTWMDKAYAEDEETDDVKTPPTCDKSGGMDQETALTSEGTTDAGGAEEESDVESTDGGFTVSAERLLEEEDQPLLHGFAPNPNSSSNTPRWGSWARDDDSNTGDPGPTELPCHIEHSVNEKTVHGDNDGSKQPITPTGIET
jgi:hypothetical protein